MENSHPWLGCSRSTALRNSEGGRPKASRSTAPGASPAICSYNSRAWPSSSCAMLLMATSLSMSGPTPVHSAWRCPIASSSSAIRSSHSRNAARTAGSPSATDEAGTVNGRPPSDRRNSRRGRRAAADGTIRRTGNSYRWPARTCRRRRWPCRGSRGPARPTNSRTGRGGHNFPWPARAPFRRPARARRRRARARHAGVPAGRPPRRRPPPRAYGPTGPPCDAPPPRREASRRRLAPPAQRLADPRVLPVERLPERETFRALRTAVAAHPLQLVPVRLGVLIALLRLEPAQPRIRDHQAVFEDDRHEPPQELLAEFLVGLHLEAPGQHRFGVRRHSVGHAEEVNDGGPPPVQRVLQHGPLGRRAFGQRPPHVEPELNVEVLLVTDALQHAGIRRIRAGPQRSLRLHRRAVYEDLNDGDVGPGLRGIVEDIVEACAALDQFGIHLLPRPADRLGDAVQQHAVTDLVLDLRGERHLAGERRRARNPLPLGQRAHDLGVGVHLDQAKRLEAILLGHPLARFNLVAGCDPGGEALEPYRLISCRRHRGHTQRPSICDVLAPVDRKPLYVHYT